jgi:hypothetical protein
MYNSQYRPTVSRPVKKKKKKLGQEKQHCRAEKSTNVLQRTYSDNNPKKERKGERAR